MEPPFKKIKLTLNESEVNLYNAVHIKGTPIYDTNEKLIGHYNGTSSIAHNGKDNGRISITSIKNEEWWYSGPAIKYKDGFKLID